MTIIDEILSRSPVNKSAALVTSQGGCEDEITLYQQRECLVLRVNQIQKQLIALPTKHRDRKILGREKYRIQSEIAAIKATTKSTKAPEVELSTYISRECRKILSATQWREAVILARAAKESDIKKYFDGVITLNDDCKITEVK